MINEKILNRLDELETEINDLQSVIGEEEEDTEAYDIASFFEERFNQLVDDDRMIVEVLNKNEVYLKMKHPHKTLHSMSNSHLNMADVNSQWKIETIWFKKHGTSVLIQRK